MKPSLLFEVIAIAACSACGSGSTASAGSSNGSGHNSSIASELTVAVAENVSESVGRYLIADSSAGPFRIGAVIPHEAEGFVVTEWSEEQVDSEAERREITTYTYEIGNEGWVKITPQYNAATGCANDRIGEIFIYSDLFLTDRGIGAMSSIEEFAAAYPDFDIRHADDDKLFIVETPRLRNVQFLVKDEYYIGADRNPASSASVRPKVADFRQKTCFTAIRIRR